MDEWIDVPEAWSRIEAEIAPLGAETVVLEAALGRVLAQRIQVDRDAPPFDRAAMDGFAVRAAEVSAARREAPVALPVAGESTPGAGFRAVVPAGSAVRIMTGAPLPRGCDSIVPVEESSGFGTHVVQLYAAVQPGQHVTPRGSERRAGEALMPAGRRLGAADLGALAMIGAATIQVGRRARVAVLATGNELVPHDRAPAATQIRNSNSPMLCALAASRAGEVQSLGIAPDDRAALRVAVRRGLEADLLLLSGGVSMGAYDFVADALESEGARFHFRRVALQPGKPVGFATHPRGAVLALPGNPVSALTTFRLFARLTLARLEGEAEARPRFDRLAARFEWRRRNPKWLLLPGSRTSDGSGVERVAYRGSGDLLAYARADCQIVLMGEIDQVQPGDRVPVWPLS